MDTPLEGRIAIVTGAGRGIGLAVAERLCRAGATSVIGELVPERGEDAARMLQQQGLRAMAMGLDVAKPESCAAVVDAVVRAHGRLDILVNNAGVFVLGKSEEVRPEDWGVQMDVLLSGTFFMAQAAARAAMIPQRRGAIVNIASIGGMGGWPMRAAYNAAKAGVINLTETLGSEWAQHNIRVNAVSPGVTRTELNQEAIRKGAASEEKYNARTPMGRMAEVGEIAEAVAFLASDAASYITGTNLKVDGGWVAHQLF